MSKRKSLNLTAAEFEHWQKLRCRIVFCDPSDQRRQFLTELAAILSKEELQEIEARTADCDEIVVQEWIGVDHFSNDTVPRLRD
jgi:hypothetical protein